MDGLNRTGGNQRAVLEAAQQAGQQAAAKARMERLADETAKYTLPGVANGLRPEEGDDHPPVTPMNLAQLRRWVEGHDGGIDVLA